MASEPDSSSSELVQDQALGFCLVYRQLLKDNTDRAVLDELQPTLKEQLGILDDATPEASATLEDLSVDRFQWLDALVEAGAASLGPEVTPAEYAIHVIALATSATSSPSPVTTTVRGESGEPEWGWIFFKLAKTAANGAVKVAPKPMQAHGRQVIATLSATATILKAVYKKQGEIAHSKAQQDKDATAETNSSR